MKTLKKSISEIGWVGREQNNGKTVANKCGRDFLYLALNYLHPEKYNASRNNPTGIDAKRLFGFTVPPYLAWTQIQFFNIATLLKRESTELKINNEPIESYFSFAWGNLFSRISYEDGLKRIEACVDLDTPCAIDISVGSGLLVLLDHVMFVYGYDEENLYVVDTLTVPIVGYELIDEKAHLYKLPKSIIRSRWSKFGRVWEMRVIQ